ncbi:unnamed protein product [Schistocephalus solidus]|uniref:PUB domain-containing protein n=1 Tax=Schistocephalus solidus TaxID=70667 RepID=A0A183TMQ5_SCHSO|nr:unnamed protein product [Schistocephalus solidus]
MSLFKSFFQKKSLDKKFARLGQGHTLTEPDKPRPSTNRASDHPPKPVCAGPSEEASKAAEAALTRIAAKKEPARVLFCHPVILGNEFTGSYSEVDSAIEQKLLGEAANNASEATTLLLIRAIERSQLPSDAEAAVEESEIDVRAKRRQNFMKILSNIISHPEKDVYRRLRVSNRFVADLLAVKYAEDFFKVCGFVRTSLPVSQNPPNVEAALPPNSETDEGSGPAAPMAEDFLILPASSTEDLTHLKSMLELLETAQPIVPLVFRDTTVLQAAGTRVRALTRDELPADFFTVSREDLRRLMDQQQKAMEESGMLLTKAMRERLKTRERRLYRFVLIRIRLPGELVLQVGSLFSPGQLLFREQELPNSVTDSVVLTSVHD